MEAKAPVRGFLPALTGYRAIAAWMVFLYHIFPFRNTSLPGWIRSTFLQFHLGVDLFFVLSGFLITYRYFNRPEQRFATYMGNRFARIYPVYFLLILGTFLYGYWQTSVWTGQQWIELLTSLTLTKTLFSTLIETGIGQGWTLTLEEIFYLSAPVFFLLLRRSWKWLLLLPALIIPGFSVLKALADQPWNTLGFLQFDFSVYLPDFFSGIGLALLYLKGKQSRFRYWTWWGAGFISLYLLTFSHFPHLTSWWRVLEISLVSALGIAPLLWGLLKENTWLRQILSSPLMVTMGKSSYVFYLIHKGFIMNFLLEHLTSNKLVLFVVLNLISWLLFRWIEEPLNGFFRRVFQSKAQPL